MKKILLIISLIFVASSSKAQNISTVFTNMPKEIVPLLSRNNRLDFIDFFNSKMLAEVDNALTGKSTLRELTDSYLKVKLNDKAMLEMKLFSGKAKGDSIIGIVTTVSAQASESEIAFYDLKWNKLTLDKLLSLPSDEAFWKKADKQRIEQAKSALGDKYMEAHLEGKDETLRFSLSLTKLSDKETEALVSSSLFKTVVYKWNGKRFVFDSKED